MRNQPRDRAFEILSRSSDRQSVYKLFVMCGDVAFVGLLPQLVLVLYFERANTYGCIASFATAIGLRILVRGCLILLLQIPT